MCVTVLCAVILEQIMRERQQMKKVVNEHRDISTLQIRHLRAGISVVGNICHYVAHMQLLCQSTLSFIYAIVLSRDKCGALSVLNFRDTREICCLKLRKKDFFFVYA